jgi:hypothetical protein
LLGVLLATSSGSAQTVPESKAPDPLPIETAPSSPPPPATRAVTFSPDSPKAQLEFHGISVVDGIWKEGWIPVCIGPCAQSVPVSARYRVAGSWITASRRFEIGPGSQPLHLEANTGSSVGRIVGTIATIVGGVAFAGGLLVAGFAGFCGLSNQPGACGSRDEQQTIGLLVAGLGGVSLASGIVLVVQNRTIVAGDAPPTSAR